MWSWVKARSGAGGASSRWHASCLRTRRAHDARRDADPAGGAGDVLWRIAASYAGRSPVDIPGVAETRALFHRLDVDPTKTRPSSEALLRRVLQGRALPRVNLAVDVCNLCSLEDQLPLGLYDRDHVRGT